jgi:putative addiction module killer protein
MLPSALEVLEYLDTSGRSPFGDWFDGLNAQAAAKISIAIIRLRQGNVSSVKSVGGGVMEYKVDFGPGYRVYFGRDGERIVVLLAGGTKRRQNEDIRVAQARWSDYKRRKT